MSDRSSSHQGIHCALESLGIFLILLSTLVAVPSVARTDIQHIGVGDTIFVYEQNLNITGLRTGANPITALRKYQDDNPTHALLRELPVQDDASFSPIPEAFGGLLGIYYAFNPTDGAMHSVLITEPSVSIDAVLASPNHSDSIQGLTLHDTSTPIAFKIVSVDVGAYYHAGALFPATVDLVLTAPGGAQLTSIQGMDFSRMNVSAQVFYTDDPGRPGAITFADLGTGTYTVQAKWHDPASFDQQAPDSNIISFSIGGTTISTGTTSPPTQTTVMTPRTPTTRVPETTTATTPLPPVTPSTPVPSIPPGTQPVTTPPVGTTLPSPTPAPTGAWLAVLSPALAMIPLIRGRARR
ncbi:MAG: DUF3821 domain-containing protein [Methanomicrobiales archaeon]|nr:DUF3821 domain-containing protein [Methanomicrobiales archaeon]